MMHTYEARAFNIPALDGISPKSIEEHIGLYQGYVKNFNAMSALMVDLMGDSEKNSLAIAELIRRRSFEFDGMRLHELYFPQFEGGPKPAAADSAFSTAIAKDFGTVDELIQRMRSAANLRGPGWALLYWDPQAEAFHIGFSGEQHQGHFVTLPVVLALDVWEHAFLLDYGALGKAKYLDAFFKNLNWETVEKRFASLRG